MNQGRTDFAQPIEYAPHKEFQGCGQKYPSKRRPPRFSYWDQDFAGRSSSSSSGSSSTCASRRSSGPPTTRCEPRSGSRSPCTCSWPSPATASGSSAISTQSYRPSASMRSRKPLSRKCFRLRDTLPRTAIFATSGRSSTCNRTLLTATGGGDQVPDGVRITTRALDQGLPGVPDWEPDTAEVVRLLEARELSQEIWGLTCHELLPRVDVGREGPALDHPSRTR